MKIESATLYRMNANATMITQASAMNATTDIYFPSVFALKLTHFVPKQTILVSVLGAIKIIIFLKGSVLKIMEM